MLSVLGLHLAGPPSFGPNRHLAALPARLLQYPEDEMGEIDARDRARGSLFRIHGHGGVGRPTIRQPRRPSNHIRKTARPADAFGPAEALGHLLVGWPG